MNPTIKAAFSRFLAEPARLPLASQPAKSSAASPSGQAAAPAPPRCARSESRLPLPPGPMQPPAASLSGHAAAPAPPRCARSESRLHFAAHSHHPWPDVSFEAHQQAWLDASRLQDDKWERVFGEIWPAAQAHVARLLRLPDPASVCFAPSIHALLLRLVSCLERRPFSVLTTDAEFLSFDRQLRRWEEAGVARTTRVTAEPFDSFEARWQLAARRGGYDLVYVSQCFYDSGFVPGGLKNLIAAVPDADALIVVDGYHGFMAFDTDFSALATRACYVAGGYKYAMAGEGCCFAHVPPGVAPRPVDTGWFAGFEALGEAAGYETTGFGAAERPTMDGRAGISRSCQSRARYGKDGTHRTPPQVAYPSDARRLLGGTFDPTPLYRFNAAMEWASAQGLAPERIHAHVGQLQARFLSKLDALRLPLTRATLLPPVGFARGNFLCFRLPGAAEVDDALAAQNVTVDHRGDRLRIGFGLYHDTEDVDELLRRLVKALG